MTILEFTDKYGNIIKATGNPRSGGEGDVYDVEGNPDLVIKVYNDKKRNKDKKLYNELITKIQAMCDICDDTIMQRAGWPQQIVYSGNKPLGFTMNKIKYCNTFHQLVDTIDRKEKFLDNNWKYSLYVAYNLACAVNALHKKNVVIGDINESNFLIGNRTIAETNGVFNFKDNGIVYSIDCDSFQISTNNKAFLCSVAKAEYLPPELVGANLHKVVRTPNHDNFGLAVLIFQLVILGRHPYMGIGVPGNITEAISGGYYVYGENAKSKGVYPPKPDGLYDAIFSSMNNEMKSLFEQAFSSQPNVVRPSAETWINALKRQIDDLVQCDEDENHYYDKDGECIWCKIKQEFGFNPWEIKPKSIINQNFGYNYSQIAYTPSVNANNKVVLPNTNNPPVTDEDSEEDIQDDDLTFDDLTPAARVLVCIMLLFQPKLLYKILTQTKANPYKIIIESPKNFIIFIVSLVLILLPIYSFIDKVSHNESSQQQEMVQKQSIEEKKTPSKPIEQPKNTNTPLTLEKQKEVQNYMANVQRNIKANWDLPQNIMKQEGYDEIKVVIAFHIAKDGSLLDKPIIKESSGLKIADIRCIEAVELTAPFSPLPSFIKDESVGVEFIFETNRKNN